MTPDDHELMLRFKAGDAAAFEILYGRHRGALYRYFLRQAARDIADDLFQEAWIRVVKSAARYVPAAPFPAYLFKIAHNVLVDHYRRAGRAADLAVDGDIEWADGDETPPIALDRAQLRARLAEAIGTLPAPQREAFLLREEGGLTLEQIAAVVGTSRETVKSRLRYAVNRLRAALAESEPIERRA